MAYIGFEIPRVFTPGLTGSDDADLHLTLVHLGKLNQAQGTSIAAWLKRVASNLPSTIPLLATDVATFGTPESPVLARLIESEEAWAGFDLHNFRRGIVDTLRTMGVAVSTQFEPWRPHITVGTDIGAYPAVRRSVSLVVTRIGLYGAPVFSSYSWPLGK